MTTSIHSRGLALSVLLALFLTATSVEAEDKRKYLIDPNTTAINGITIATKERDIMSRLGKPKSVESGYSEVLSKPSKYLHYDGLKIYVIEGSIYNLSCTTRRCQTDRGVKVGDRKSKVIEVYGPGNKPYAGSERDTLNYPLRGYDSYLFFIFQNDVVTEIEFWVDFT